MDGIELVGSWFTPTILFCVLNLVIFFIYLLNPKSKHTSTQEYHNSPLLIRVPSLFGRIKSINHSVYQTSLPLSKWDPPSQETKWRREGKPKPTEIEAKLTMREEKPVAIEEKPAMKEEKTVVIEVKQAVREEKPVMREVKQVARRLNKSASVRVQEPEAEEAVEQRRPATMKETTAASQEGEGGDEGVDAKADDFINKFRRQLKLQRSADRLQFGDVRER